MTFYEFISLNVWVFVICYFLFVPIWSILRIFYDFDDSTGIKVDFRKK